MPILFGGSTPSLGNFSGFNYYFFLGLLNIFWRIVLSQLLNTNAGRRSCGYKVPVIRWIRYWSVSLLICLDYWDVERTNCLRVAQRFVLISFPFPFLAFYANLMIFLHMIYFLFHNNLVQVTHNCGWESDFSYRTYDPVLISGSCLLYAVSCFGL